MEDNAWFFDTELLVLAERSGLRIHEVPVDRVDDPDSRVDTAPTAMADVKGLVRVGRGLLRATIPVREVGPRLGRVSTDAGGGRLGMLVVVFVLVAVASTLAYAVLYLWFRGTLVALVANLLALLLTALANTAANRRFTFGVRGPERALRHQVQRLVTFAVGLVSPASRCGWWTRAVRACPGLHGIEVVVLIAANLFVTVTRFVAMRAWVFVRERE